jgi:regulator of nucleoside diphosphate kinase
MPPDTVTMNSLVLCVDETTGAEHQLQLVYPRDADAAQGKVSVLAPVGAALLGLSAGQAIDWPLPGGRSTRLRVLRVIDQPEAHGRLD